VKAGSWDPSPAGRAVAITLAAWAEFESRTKSDRSKRKALQDARAGKWSVGGTRGWGYAGDGKVVDVEAQVIRRIADLILLEGYTKGMAVRWLKCARPHHADRRSLEADDAETVQALVRSGAMQAPARFDQ
jgi:DNA invertase Pin-like site-specific DNA recombinase